MEIESNPSETDPVEESRMTLGEHLDELRVRLIRATIAILVIFCVAWGFRHTLDRWSQRPYHQARLRLNPIIAERAEEAVGQDPGAWEEWYVEEPVAGSERPPLKDGVLIPKRMKGDTAALGFIYFMKVCLYFSLFFGGPFLLWEMWQFVAAGLYRNERKVVRLYFPFSASLFLGGVLFGYFVMVPNALYFLALQTVTSIQWYQSINGYWTFLLNL
ncbi:MAG: twin-arginine translocase subunit TatC, partial [Planctomycetota bacterium]